MRHALIRPVSEADYLAGELTAPVRHEYVAGQVFAMTGASKAHNVITGNVFTRLRAGLPGLRLDLATINADSGVAD